MNEYRQIEKDAALARRFQNVLVTEPSVQDTISILSGIKDRYEVHHGGIRISDAALVAAASYSHRYITNRFLPDKAIDLVDEAASALRIQQESKPDAIQELDRQIMTIKIESDYLKKEPDVTSMERMEILGDNLTSKQSKIAKLTEIWNKKKLEIDAIKTAKSKLEEAKIELDLAQRENDFEKASRITYSTIPELLEKLPKEHSEAPCSNQNSEMTVTADDIAAVVSKTTGIPLQRLQLGEIEKLVHMEDSLRQSIRGQDEALSAVANAVRMQRAGLSGETRPIASFMFLGPTGVGKTYSSPLCHLQRQSFC